MKIKETINKVGETLDSKSLREVMTVDSCSVTATKSFNSFISATIPKNDPSILVLTTIGDEKNKCYDFQRVTNSEGEKCSKVFSYTLSKCNQNCSKDFPLDGIEVGNKIEIIELVPPPLPPVTSRGTVTVVQG